MLILVYLIVALIVMYIHAHGAFIKGQEYPWKEDILLCLIWPITVPLGIVMIVASEGHP
jgi:ABC-type Mn2+/Zn2+ transport system permease subunit